MSWLFSQALGVEFSVDNCWDGEPYAEWNVMPTQRGFWRKDKMMECSSLSRFGPTLRLLTEDHGEALLMWYQAGFRARTSALPEMVEDLTENEADSGPKWRASFAKYGRDSSSWRTHQHSLLGGLDEYSETWPRWGLMRDGECWEQQTLTPLMIDTESGLSERFPTPTVCGNYNRKGCSKTSGDGLATYVRKFPAPCARDCRGVHRSERGLERCMESKRGIPLNEFVGGLLNPAWVEWLMGWPTGWTALKPLAMDKYREWLQQHLKY